MKKRKKRSEKSCNSLINDLILLTVKAAAVFAVMLLLSALGCFFADIDYDNYFIFLLFSAVISSFICGFSYSRKKKKRGVINGIIAVLPVAVIILVTTFITTAADVTILLLAVIVSVILSGAASGAIGVNLGG